MAATASKTARKATKKSANKSATPPAKKWSQQVTEHSDAMDLEAGVFKQRSARKIAESLKASAEHSNRRKAGPFQSAMSMLNFYINRAGDTVSAAQHARLEKAKDALRELFDRPVPPATAGTTRTSKTTAKKGAKKAAKTVAKTAAKTPARKAAKTASGKTATRKKTQA